MDRNNVIGREGDLPWRLPSDLKHFKRVTLGKPCLMGRKTWESLPFPLPGRPNLVLSRNEEYKAKGAEMFSDINAMVGQGFELAGASGVDEVMLIGGAQLYKTLLPRCDRLYVTRVDADVDGDAAFPEIDPNQWHLSREDSPEKSPKDEFNFTIAVFDRVSVV